MATLNAAPQAVAFPCDSPAQHYAIDLLLQTTHRKAGSESKGTVIRFTVIYVPIIAAYYMDALMNCWSLKLLVPPPWFLPDGVFHSSATCCFWALCCACKQSQLKGGDPRSTEYSPAPNRAHFLPSAPADTLLNKCCCVCWSFYSLFISQVCNIVGKCCF